MIGEDVVTSRSVLPRGLVVVLGTAGLLVTALCLQRFASIVAPVLLALVLVIGVHPLTGVLRRRGAPQWLAVTATVVTLLVLVLGFAVAVAVSVAQLATLLPTYQDRFVQLVADAQAGLASVGVGPDQVRAALGSVSFGTIAALVLGVLSGFAGAFSNLSFLMFVVGFMALAAAHFSRSLDDGAPQRVGTVVALGNFVRGTRSYLLISTVFGLIVAAVDAGFLRAVGVPLPLLWGLLAFITKTTSPTSAS